MLFSRIDRSVLGRWWWEVDRWMLITALILMLLGTFLCMAASPGVANRIGVGQFFFVRHHVMMLWPALILMVGCSLFPPSILRRVCWVGFFLCFILLLLTPLLGTPIKGARRWISIFGLSIQVSELIKPIFAVVSACLLSVRSSWILSVVFFLSVISLLIIQPDLGMVGVITGVWVTQIFLGGLAWKWVISLLCLGGGGLVGAYFFLPHATSRINRFLNPESGDTYQITHSLDAFVKGGWFGKGPGEGIVKQYLPDAHADFIFSVAGEEFGFVLCVVLIFLFVFMIGRGFYHALQQSDLFITLALGGIMTQLALQTIIHMSSSLNLIPTKGMTLPFISYGGSSLLSVSIGVGMALSLTRCYSKREEI